MVLRQPGRNIRAHCDLSNALFATFLDETTTYSSALFEGEPDHSAEPPAEAQAEAQRRKIDRLLDAATVGPATRVLELGSGWGEMAGVPADVVGLSRLLRGRIPQAVPRRRPVGADEVQSVTALPRAA